MTSATETASDLDSCIRKPTLQPRWHFPHQMIGELLSLEVLKIEIIETDRSS